VSLSSNRFVLRRLRLALCIVSLTAAPAAAQASGAGDGVRFGVSVGGISTVGVVVEIFRDTHALELGVGTWSFRDLSVSAVYKEYFGASRLRPFVGAGLWAVAARAIDDTEQTGLALVLRAPVGVDWSFADDHAAGLALNLNLGLAVRRSDPLDDLPMNRRLVPLPELYHRFKRD
jgi:hypothetical protein